MDLHYSQTSGVNSDAPLMFHYLMDLHYSQTSKNVTFEKKGFTTLWIYTILKLSAFDSKVATSFTTLWIYTILKPAGDLCAVGVSFTTLWIYTILKPFRLNQ